MRVQKDFAGMAPYGYGSYPRTEATQFDPEDISSIVERISQNLKLLSENGEYADLISFLEIKDSKILLSNVKILDEEIVESEPLSYPESLIRQREEIPQKIHFGLPKELIREKEEFFNPEHEEEDLDVSDWL
jgi:hypothetical protein